MSRTPGHAPSHREAPHDDHAAAASANGVASPPHGLLAAGPRTTVTLQLNGETRSVHTAPMRRLLDVLRIEFAQTGTKEGCGEGECGACTVLLDGEPVNACLVAIVQCEGRTITTVEGLADSDVLHPVQQAFLDHGGAQCVICTPGMVVTAAWLVEKGLPPGGIREGLSGNICRCTGYNAIIDAVDQAVRTCAGRRACALSQVGANKSAGGAAEGGAR